MSQACLAYIDRARITRHTRCSNQLKKERKISKEGKKDIANRKKKEHVISTVTRAERTRIAELDIMPKSSVTSYRRNAKGRSMQEEEKGCTVKVRRWMLYVPSHSSSIPERWKPRGDVPCNAKMTRSFYRSAKDANEALWIRIAHSSLNKLARANDKRFDVYTASVRVCWDYTAPSANNIRSITAQQRAIAPIHYAGRTGTLKLYDLISAGTNARAARKKKKE